MSTSFVLAGLPESGKTTYLAALFHLLRTHAKNAANLQLAELPDGHEYLMEAEATWLQFEPFERTVIASPGRLAIPLVHDGAGTELVIPDMRGEDFEQLWEYGTSDVPLAETVAAASGILLFVRADAVQESGRVVSEIERITIGETFDLGDWDAESAPTQAKLCDVLARLGLLGGKRRIALVVSAWDTVKSNETPDAWMQRRLPLLHQAFEANSADVKAFAISAQGGDITDKAVVEELSKREPVARVADPLTRIGDDLTAPLLWLLQA